MIRTVWLVRTVALLGAVAVAWLVTFLKSSVDDAVTRPYRAPSRLIIANPTSDYASEVLEDGTILLRHHPGSSALALAGWYKKSPPVGPSLVDALVAGMKEHPRYRSLEVPEAPCRSDATTSTATRGELTFDDGAKVTLFTCSLAKHGDAYFLAWAARTKDVGADERRLGSMLRGSQLVPNDLCAVNVINGGCAPSASGMLAALVENARR